MKLPKKKKPQGWKPTEQNENVKIKNTLRICLCVVVYDVREM